MISWGDWAPDAADFDVSVARVANNVLPGTGFYMPAQALAAISTALAAKCVGAFMMKTLTGTIVIFAGTATKLYKYASGSFTDFSGALTFAVPSDNYWSFTPFGNWCYCTNAANGLHKVDAEVGTAFAAVAGGPVAKHITTIGDYLVVWGITSDLNTVKWSGLNDGDGWTVGVNSSGEQTFPDGGGVMHCSGLESGVVIQEECRRQMIYQPQSDLVFLFEKIEGALGTRAPYSCLSIGAVTFGYGTDGFFAMAGNQSKNIGLDRVNGTFLDDILTAEIPRIFAVVDPRAPRILWGYRSVNAGSADNFDKIIGFDFARNKWFEVSVNVQILLAAASAGYTLESLDAFGTLDTLAASLDSAAWAGGVPQLGGFDDDNKLGFFDGATLEATVESGEMQLIPGMRAFVSGVTPFVDAAGAQIRLGARETQQDAVAYTAERSRNPRGADWPARSSSRFHRVKMRVPAATTWTKTQGFDVTFTEDGNL